ncbi:hypothetical protein EV646_102568 [Kribbella antiqua]|uniref:Uncharacterized protein n=1 Tax=Kribbella antiqua TaxID=2512217 RepID=A0A4R2IY79_9ACTN|nr:hypothetical protein EV646_102568 [Kribbella antiqua]
MVPLPFSAEHLSSTGGRSLLPAPAIVAPPGPYLIPRRVASGGCGGVVRPHPFSAEHLSSTGGRSLLPAPAIVAPPGPYLIPRRVASGGCGGVVRPHPFSAEHLSSTGGRSLLPAPAIVAPPSPYPISRRVASGGCGGVVRPHPFSAEAPVINRAVASVGGPHRPAGLADISTEALHPPASLSTATTNPATPPPPPRRRDPPAPPHSLRLGDACAAAPLPAGFAHSRHGRGRCPILSTSSPRHLSCPPPSLCARQHPVPGRRSVRLALRDTRAAAPFASSRAAGHSCRRPASSRRAASARWGRSFAGRACRPRLSWSSWIGSRWLSLSRWFGLLAWSGSSGWGCSSARLVRGCGGFLDEEGDVQLAGPAVDFGGEGLGAGGVAFGADEGDDERLLGEGAGDVAGLLAEFG